VRETTRAVWAWSARRIFDPHTTLALECSNMALPIQVIATLWGAGAAAITTLLIKYGGWLLARKNRARAIRIALYYEVFRNQIVETGQSPDGPDFQLVGFTRTAYDIFLGEIPDLLPEKLTGLLSLYYANMTLGASLLSTIDVSTSKVQAADEEAIRVQARANIRNPVHPMEVAALKCEFSQFCPLFSLNSVPSPRALTLGSRVGRGGPPLL